MTPPAPTRADALRLVGLAADVPDAILSDCVAEALGLDAQTLRRGWALDRARSLLVRLAAHSGRDPVCERCGADLLRPEDVPARQRHVLGGEMHGRRWCLRCSAWSRPGPSPAGLLASLAAALAEADDPRAGNLGDDRHEPDWLPGRLVVTACPRCGQVNRLATGATSYCRCGWSGPATALLPPLMTWAELNADVAEMRRK